MDNFEKHIRENAAKFDTHKADRAKMWANISAEIQKKEPKVIPLWKRPMLRIAASVVLMIGIAAIIGLYRYGNTSADTQYASKELLEIDVAAGRTKDLKPAQLRETREEYKQFTNNKQWSKAVNKEEEKQRKECFWADKRNREGQKRHAKRREAQLREYFEL